VKSETRKSKNGTSTLSVACCFKAIETMGKKTGAFETVASGDPLVFLPDNLAQFDAVLINNMHEQHPMLPIDFAKLSEAEKEAARQREHLLKRIFVPAMACTFFNLAVPVRAAAPLDPPRASEPRHLGSYHGPLYDPFTKGSVPGFVNSVHWRRRFRLPLRLCLKVSLDRSRLRAPVKTPFTRHTL
jgi:hypothetical protein